MNVAGIDYTTERIDIVVVDRDDDARWFRYSLPSVGDAFERTREIPEVIPTRRAVFWSDIAAIGLERPMGVNRRSGGTLAPVMGAILACIPRHVLVEPLMPSRWRVTVGLAGNASKEDVRAFAETWRAEHGTGEGRDVEWTQDACDALCMALTVRALVEVVA